MANDFIERLETVLINFLGCATADGHILDLDAFNVNIEELAYIVNKMRQEVD